MKKNRAFLGILILSISLLISACTPESPANDNPDEDNSALEEEIEKKDIRIKELESKIEELEEDDQIEDNSQNPETQHLMIRAVNVLESLMERDIESLKEYIHPDKGVRFTAYPHVNLEEDIVLEKDAILAAYDSSETYNWGNYDGRGDPIELSFKDYYDEFVYDEDFLNPQIIGNNTIVSGGNTIDNVIEAYPDGKFIESYFEVFEEEYRGMDWKSLKLVFEKEGDTWYLVGLIHGQWTI